MAQLSLPFRQVHLDFHTSEHCADVGGSFDAQTFAATLADAHINSINIFAKCHHGYSYYPTQVGTTHPTLKFDLLGEMIEALHRRDIACPVYYSIMWDELAGREHPEWRIVNKDGTLADRAPLSGGWGWATLDVASGYRDYCFAATEEIMSLYAVDGMWFDICFSMPNYASWSKLRMQQAGVNVENDAEVWAYARKSQTDFFNDMTKLVHGKKPSALIYYNGTIKPDMRRVAPYMTHLEVESLPTTGQWGYLHYPIAARQTRTYGMDFIGMNGRFHTSWGDFGGLKTTDQLDYEVGTILSAGGKVCVGDQLHPSGALDPAVYRLIGRTFQRVEALEPWLIDAVPTAELAIVVDGGGASNSGGIAAYGPDIEGAAQMLLELGYQFDIIDTEGDFSRYPALILPDGLAVDDSLAARLRVYLANGGRIIASGTAALDPELRAFKLDAIPVRYLQPAPTVPSYLRPDAYLAGNSELASDYDYVFYDQAHLVQLVEGATGYGELKCALFNRTWEHFISHRQAPVDQALGTPVAARKGNVLYFAAPLFAGFRQHDYWAYRALAQNALADLLPPRLVRPTAPNWSEFSLLEQAAGEKHPARQIVHVVCYHPRRSMQPIPHVDQSWATAGMQVAIRRDAAPAQVYTAPDRQPLRFHHAEGYVHIELPPVGAHTVLVVE
jgi:hypothetical protein